MAAGLIENHTASVRHEHKLPWSVVRALSKLNLDRPNQFATGEESQREAALAKKREANR
jgi:hypothetical protein